MLTVRAMSIVLVVAGLTACGGSSGGTAPPANSNPPPGGGGPGASPSVTVSNNSYTPGQVTVARGGTVTWRWDSCTDDGYGNRDCVAHSVTFDDGSQGAAVQSTGQFARSFSNAGTFGYYCTAHGRGVMSGSVVVQ